MSFIDFIDGDVCVTVYSSATAGSPCRGIGAVGFNVDIPKPPPSTDTFPITIRADLFSPCVSVEINEPDCGPPSSG